MRKQQMWRTNSGEIGSKRVRSVLRSCALLAGICFGICASPALAEGRCPDGYFPIGGGDAGWEGCAPMGGDEAGNEARGGDGAPSLQSFSPEDWNAFFAHMGQVDAANGRERTIMGQRYRALKEGLWFMPGEVPFAGWVRAKPATPVRQKITPHQGGMCTASFWTMTGAVTLAARRRDPGPAVLSFMGSTIPAPQRPEFRKIALTQSGRTQSVKAWISRSGGRKPMGIVSFAVPSGAVLVRSIEDSQDYQLAENGKTLFAGRWHGGSIARSALARCLGLPG